MPSVPRPSDESAAPHRDRAPYIDVWRRRFRQEVVPVLPQPVSCRDGHRRDRGLVVGVARALADLADFGDGRVSASVDTIAASSGYGRKVIMPVLDVLRDAGVLVDEAAHGRATATRRRLLIAGLPADLAPATATPDTNDGPSRGTVKADDDSPHRGTVKAVDNGFDGPSAGFDSPSSGFDSPSSRDPSTTHHTNHLSPRERADAEPTHQSESRETPSDPLGEELRAALRARGADTTRWTDDDLDRVRTHVMNRLDGFGSLPLVAPLLHDLAGKAVHNPLAYVRPWTREQLEAPATRAAQANGHSRAYPAAPPPRPPWCGACYEQTRRLEDPDDGRDLGPCPRCHPTRSTA